MKILPNIAFGSAFLNNTPIGCDDDPCDQGSCQKQWVGCQETLYSFKLWIYPQGACTLIGKATNLVIAGLVNEMLERGATDLPHMVLVGMLTFL